ncbi:MAG: hypothetical protein NC453_24100, partial [Muribaculum sp.]|nr:hypothetical protein [Muribaculum sp.]
MDFDDLDKYNEDSIHDMYVDSDYEINTGELPEVFDEADLDEFIDSSFGFGVDAATCCPDGL